MPTPYSGVFEIDSTVEMLAIEDRSIGSPFSVPELRPHIWFVREALTHPVSEPDSAVQAVGLEPMQLLAQFLPELVVGSEFCRPTQRVQEPPS